MSASQPDPRFLVAHESSDLSNLSTATTLPDEGQEQSPVQRRAGYARLDSSDPIDENARRKKRVENEEDIADTFHNASPTQTRGLGIASAIPSPENQSGLRHSSVSRVPVGSKSPPAKSPTAKSPSSTSTTPGLGHYLAGSWNKSPPIELESRYVTVPDHSPDDQNHRRHPSVSSFHSEAHQPFMQGADTDRLTAPQTPSVAPSHKSAYDADFSPRDSCPTHKTFYQGRGHWFSVSILVLSIYSTVFSGIYAFLAAKGPRYGGRIRTHGTLTPEGAVVLTSVIAKTIELSFVTAFVTFLGQVLSRRAFIREQGRGVTLAEMTMRNWIMQPGTLLTHWTAVRYAGLSLLGGLSLLAAVVATLYTAASTALVQPQLRFGDWEYKLMMGEVKTSFANPQYLEDQCATPIKNDGDSNGQNVAGSTCLQIEHAAQGFHNYIQYIANWANISNTGDGTVQMSNRPGGTGLIGQNITISAQWIEIVDVPSTSQNYGRIINNVSLAMPHAGVPAAAEYPDNGIIQPNDLDGQGIYSLHASVPSPVVHVLCANADAADLDPIVYSSWPNANVSLLGTEWPAIAETPQNKTALDDIFGWGNDWANASSNQGPRPAFPKLPSPFNTLLNYSNIWGPDSLYLLGRAPPSSGEIYVLCSLKASLTGSCSTRFNASGTGGTIEAICEDNNDEMQYVKSLTNWTSAFSAPSKDWKNIASDWGDALSLNAGEFDGNASNARLLTQLILDQPQLNEALPSPAEALAVMSSCTLMMSTLDAPFVPFYNYSSTAITIPQKQYFNATIRAQEYGSGGTGAANRGFFLILFAAFILNLWVLVYFVVHRGLVTDFSEPPNMFSIAVNSPPSRQLAGSCGAGPVGRQYQVNWFVNTEGDHLFMEPGEREVVTAGRFGWSRTSKRPSSGVELLNTPIASMYSKLANRRSFH